MRGESMGRKVLCHPDLATAEFVKLACAHSLSRDDGASNILNIRTEMIHEGDIDLDLEYWCYVCYVLI